jgi:hypothetical protein
MMVGKSVVVEEEVERGREEEEVWGRGQLVI